MLDIIIVFAYLLGNLIFGLMTSKNIKTFKDYAISERNYPLAVMIATISATWIGGGTVIGLTEKVYEVGMVFFLVFLGDFFCKIFNSFFVAPKIGKFYGLVSTGDIMELSYGKKAKIITGLCSIFLSIGVIATQVSAMSYFLSEFLNISKFLAIILGFGVIVVYATAGGIKSVTFTDLLQFLILVVGLPIILGFSIKELGGISSFFARIPVAKWSLSQTNHNLANFSSFIVFSLALSSPVLTQRLLMSSDHKQAIKSMNIAAFLDIPIYLIISLIGMAVWAINPHLEPVNSFPYLVHQVLPPIVKGLAVAAILAAIMSTADSFLNSASVSFVQDVIKPLAKEKLEDRILLKLAKILTIIVAIIGIYVAYYVESVYKILFYTRIAWQPFIMFPFLAVVLGWKTDYRSFYISILASFFVIASWEIFNLGRFIDIHVILAGSFTSFFSFCLANLYFKKVEQSK